MDNMKLITEIAKENNINSDLDLYGKYKAKINEYIPKNNKKGKLILVTSTNPTPMGEGKTTLSIGLVDSLKYLNKNAVVVLREPSLGPVFGSKGGAAGGGLAKVVPEDDINLHFNGDFHAITSANNLLCAIIDNHIYQGNELKIKEVTFKRCLDVNDRALRHIKLDSREESFVITPASEIMAIFCLSTSFDDLKRRLGNIIVGFNEDNKAVLAKELNCVDALALLLKDAIKPNLVQTLFNSPAIVHGGPFANIAHGCNSIIATKYALDNFDYVVTEAGFGSDCGALKFLDLKCNVANIYPDLIVINSTIKALKYNGNDNLKEGFENLKYHINLMKNYSDKIIVSLNKFDTDTDDEIAKLKELVENENVPFVVSTMFKDGNTGCLDLANIIDEYAVNEKRFKAYENEDTIYEKIEKLCHMYGAKEVIYTDEAKKNIDKILNDDLYKNFRICIAKTPASITDDKNKLGAPKDFTMTVTNIQVEGGAEFIVVYMGNILTMPGLGKTPNYEKIRIS